MAEYSRTWGDGDEGYTFIQVSATVEWLDVTPDGLYAFLKDGNVVYIPKGSMPQPQIRPNRPRQ